jgi:hypothetical protein
MAFLGGSNDINQASFVDDRLEAARSRADPKLLVCLDELNDVHRSTVDRARPALDRTVLVRTRPAEPPGLRAKSFRLAGGAGVGCWSP